MHKQLLIISGGGDFAGVPRLNGKVCDIFRELPTSKMLVIPFAADEEDYDGIKEYVDDSLGAVFEVIDIMHSPDEAANVDLAQYDLIYLEGGNTFELLQAIRTSSLMTEIQRYYKGGGALLGDSAGAIVLGANADTAFFGDEMDENYTGMQHFAGLDLLQSWSIHCHYKAEEDEECQDFVYSSGSQLLAVPEDSALTIEKDGTITVYGAQPVAVFSFMGKKKFLAGQQFNLAQIDSEKS